jgi:hypothetical protein|nr:MAG TPA: hypothetical protein [Caudoviricetes sp.]
MYLMAGSFEDIAPIKNRKDKHKNQRYDYEGKILLKTVSNVLLGNHFIVGLLSKIEYVIQNILESIKGIGNKINYLEDPK